MRHSLSITATAIASTAVFAVLVLTANPLHAQTADSTFFRAGQWGAEFTLGGFNSVGVLRFSTPKRAWIGEVRATYQSFDNENNTAPLSGLREIRSVDLQIGSRWYRTLDDKIAQHITVGALAGSARQERDRPTSIGTPTSTETSSNISAGLFADLGAQWMVTSNLSLGATYGVTARVARSSTDAQFSETKSTNTTLTLGPVGIRAALYF